MRRVDWALCAVWMVLLTAAAQGQMPAENGRCLACHGSADLVERSAEERGLMVRALPGIEPREIGEGLFVSAEEYESSVHRSIRCTQCHPDAERLPHGIRTERAQCGECHAQELQEYSTSVHGRAIVGGDLEAASCNDCHGTHAIRRSSDEASSTYKLQLPYTCAKCHSNPELMSQVRVHQPHASEQFLESMHGRGLTASGLIIAPSCNDCHGVHEILPASDRRSKIHHDNVPFTCGTCHVGVERIYRDSVHGRRLARGDENAPVCTTCHTAHDIIPAEGTAFKLASDEKCGQCHEDRLEKYRETFHGKAMVLGLSGVAACFDCHGKHDIYSIDEQSGPLAKGNRLKTCQKCHLSATEKFTDYIAHADHSDREHYPVLYWTYTFMTTIVIGTFVFFGLHTVFWLVRSGTMYFRDPEKFRSVKASLHEDDVVYSRFRPFERFLHVLVVLSFLLLVATGMPVKFFDTEWAQWIVWMFGGLEVTTALHRAGAVVTFAYLGLHVASMLWAGFARRERFRNPETGRFSLRRVVGIVFGPDLPFPHWTDVRDWWAHQKWFFGRGPRPQWDRWTYWEKFDYMAVFWGVGVIGLSGLVMWFPTAFTRFLPGWAINVAVIIHSDEALLAAGFIFTVHFFNGHFRIEKFPMDTIIFSGRISRSEMLHERKRWYDRLEKSGTLEGLRLQDEWGQWKYVIQPLGFMAFAIGVVLLVLIFYAMGSRLLFGH